MLGGRRISIAFGESGTHVSGSKKKIAKKRGGGIQTS